MPIPNPGPRPWPMPHNRTIRRFVMAAALVACAAIGCRKPAPPEPAKQPEARPAPNVVLITIDALRPDRLGCYGFPHAVSPEIDAIAEKSVLFERVFAPCSWTRPSFGGFLTGLYPRSLGLYKELGQRLPESAESLAELLKSAGYRTIGATANPNINRVFGFGQGFDAYLESHAVWSWMQPLMDGEQRPTGEEVTLASAQALYDWVFSQIEPAAQEPHYLQICIMETHEYDRGAHALTRDEFKGLFTKLPEHRYLQAVRQASVDTSAFIERLLELQGWDNTLFIIMSDHGEGLFDHPNVENSTYHASLLYESMILVPWIIYDPSGSLKPGRVAQDVRLLDLMPTVLDLAGVPVPPGLHGRSLAALVRGESASVELPRYFVSESYIRWVDKSAVHGPEWHYFDHRDADVHKGIDRKELQAAKATSDGSGTNQFSAHPKLAAEMAVFLAEWDRRYPKAEPTVQEEELSEEEIQQLKSSGYLE